MDEKKRHIKPSPWLVVGSAMILLIVVVVLAFQNINRDKLNMSRILSEKGASLIKSFEAGARTGLMSVLRGGNHLQRLLEETAKQEDILYIFLTDLQGNIVAHNDKTNIGGKITGIESIKMLIPESGVKWRLTEFGNKQSVFEVFGYFQPVNLQGSQRQGAHRITPGDNSSTADNRAFSPLFAYSNRIIFIGLDIEPFENARREDIRNTIIISSVLVMLGLGGLISLYWAQNYRSARRSLQDTSAFADEVVTNLPVGLVATGREKRITFFNSAAEKIILVKREDAIGKNPAEVLPDGLSELMDHEARIGTILDKEMECPFPGRKTLPLSVSAASIINEAGTLVGNILILKDLEEVRKLQKEIRRKEKLAALGSLAAGVAHEIRNPLSSIKGMATYFRDMFVQGSDDRQAADVMIREVDRLDRVISELLYYARPSDLKPKLMDINGIIDHTVRLAAQDTRAKDIDIKWAPAKDLPQIMIDPDRFSQCLLNLYLNAIQAMDKGGVLSITCRMTPDREMEIKVSDTGQGMSFDDLTKIFDPYFTTKPSGTGLGLAIVHKIIEAHKGRIEVESVPGKGTVFYIHIPVEKED